MPVPGQQPQQPRSVYDDIADQDVQKTNQQIAQAVAVSSGNNPDEVGQAQQVGAKVGIGADLAMQHMDEIKKSIALQQVQERDLASWNPMLARQLTDPDFAAIAHDNIDNLQTTGTLFQRFKASAKDVGFALANSGAGGANFGPALAITQTGQELGNAADQGYQQYERGMLGIKVKRGEATADDWTRIHEIDAARKAPQAPIETLGGQVFGGVANMAGSIAPVVPHSLAVGAAGAGVGAIVGAAATPEGLGAGAIPGAFTGFKYGFWSEFNAENYETIAGNAYADMLERGVDETRAQWAAGAVGAVNTALQMGVMKVIGKPLGKIAGTAFNRAIGAEVADAMTQPTTAAAVKAAMLAWGKHTAIGTGEMGLQTIVDRVGNDYADRKGVGGTTSDLFSADFGHVLGKSLVDAALTMSTINATTGMMGFSADMSRVQKAEQSAAFFESLSQNAEASKVRDRNPNAYEKFIASQAQGTSADTIYIDGRQMGALLHQSGIDPERIAPGFGEELANASATGGDVQIPTSQYAAQLAGTPLGKAMQAHMRLDPDAMSATEAVEFQQKQQEIFGQMRQEAEQQTATSAEFAKSAKVVEGNIFDQLKATKTMPDTVARTNAQFVRDFVVTQAARQNMTPEAFFDKYRYTILKGDGGDLAQAAYHGSPHNFEQFTLDRIGSGEGMQAYGHGLYFAGDKNVAEYYRQQLAEQTPYIDGKRAVFTNPEHLAAVTLARHGGDGEKAIRDLQWWAVDRAYHYPDDEVEAARKAIEAIQSGDKLPEVERRGGQLYEANIPDDHTMLHWDKPLSEQPSAVQKAIAELDPVTNKSGQDMRGLDATGGELYEAIARERGKIGASGTLLDEGVTGIKYLDGNSRKAGAGHHNYVVFDDQTIKILKKFYQSAEDGNRGGFDPSSLTTLLGQKADMSTFLHETAHYFLAVMGELAKEGSDESTKEDFGKLLNWFGVKDQATWDGMSLEEQRQHHEKFAYSFEKYLEDGKAPSIEAQGMFDRFSQWLKRVYKSVRDDTNTIYRQQHGEDLPIMTGEVRDVMDRMLASDEQIKQAQAIRNMEPLFKSQEASRMSDAKWKAYGDMDNTATEAASAELGGKSIREMQWMSNAKGRLLRAMQAQHERIREGIRSQVRDEMAREEPVYRAQRFLKTGEWEGEETSESHKMDTEETRKLLPEGMNLGPLSKLFGMTKKGGIHPDDVAAAAGFKDGKEMVDAIIGAPALKDAVDAETDRRMLDEHGDMATPNAIATAVEKAIHNEARARFIAFEMRHAFNMDESERVLVQAARETARKAVERQKFAELQPSAYAAREAAAARQAIAAQARGDMEGVGRAKRDQLLQNAMASEALRVKAEADQALSFLNKFDNPSKAITKAIGADHMDAINELLAGYQVSPRDRYSNRRENMAVWLDAEYSRTGVMPAVPDAIIDKLGKMHWKDMNIVQLRDLRDAVKSLDYTGRQQTLVEIGEKQQTVDELVDAVQDKLVDMPHTPVTDIRADLKYAKGMDKLSARFLSLKSWVKSADAALVKMEQFFQWIDAGKDAGLKEAPIDGPMQRIYRLASKAEATERTMRAAATAAMRQVHERLKGTNINLSEALDIPELPREGQGTRWYRGELIAATLNMGNQSNAEKLLAGYGWEHQAVISAINRLLSPEEMSFVQGTLDHLATYGDGISELQRRQTGVSPQMIEAMPLVTKHGTFPGGYYPVVFNDVLDDVAAQNQARNADRLFENNYANPQTASGHTIARTGYIGPLFLDLGVIARHIDQVTHDLAWREAVIDMNKVLSDPRLKTELNQVYGPEYSKQFRPWLQAMANDKVFNTAGDSAIENGVKKIRSNFTMVGIGFRMSTMAIHGTSALSNSLGELGPTWFAKGAAQFAGVDRFQQARDFMYERSPEMANRMNEADRNIHEAIRGIEAQRDSLDTSTAARQLYDNTRKFAFRGVGILDMASAGPTWMGAYLKGMAHEADGGMGMGEDDAIAYADRAVRNAHGGGGTKDLASIQRDKGVMSLATMFYSYWNHVYNRQRDLGKGWSQAVTGQAAARDFPKLLARSWFYLVVPALAHSLLAGGKKKDDDGTLEGFAKESAEGIGLSFVSGIPIVRDIANAAVHGTDYAISPLEKAGQAFVNTFKDVKAVFSGDEPKRGFQNTAESLGYATGLPTAQPAATAKFLYDVFDGDQRPEDIADWWRGVLTGKIK